MVNQTILRVWSAGSWLVNPGRLIDRLLDRLEDLSLAMVPAHVEMREIRVETRFD
jgi:hypothetical protein